MTVQFFTRALLLSLVGVSLSGLTACTPVVKEEVDIADVVTYRLAESGTIDVVYRGEKISTEQYTIEIGSDGHYVVSATATPTQEGQNVRNVTMEFDQAFKPIRYSEEAEGATPLKVFISFLEDKAIFNIKQGDEPQVSKTVEGAYETYVDVGLYHHHGLIARAYIARNTTEKVDFAMVGGETISVEELKPTTLEIGGQSVPVRHLALYLKGGKLKEHLWIRGDDFQFLKVEAGRGALTATRTDIPEASQLSVRKKKIQEDTTSTEETGEGTEDSGEGTESGEEN